MCVGSAGDWTKSRQKASERYHRQRGQAWLWKSPSSWMVGEQKSTLSFFGHSVFATVREVMLSYTDASVRSAAAAAAMLPKPRKHLVLAV